MSTDPLQAELEAIVAPLVAAQGLEFWGLEFARGKRAVLRIYVEAPPVPEGVEVQETAQDEAVAQGVNIDQCARVSRQVGLALDVEDIVPGAYTLEVSSPGLSRPFFSLEQMHGYEGEEMETALHEATLPEFPGRKSFKGRLLRVGEGGFVLEVADGPEGERAEAELAWMNVKKALLAPEVAVPAMPKKKKKRKKGKGGA